MIVQTALPSAQNLAITMAEHAKLAGQLARAFGNELFEPVAPRDLMLYVIDHHDQGWSALDAAPGTDPRSGLPYDLIDTPLEDIAKTSASSPDFNERRHAYCGLLSSMHSWGLYNGRYGISDKVLINSIPATDRPLIARMLDEELTRQRDLKARLAADPATAEWIEEGRLFQNYKQLQFFDTLALYFNRTHEDGRAETQFSHVPHDTRRDTTINVRPVGKTVYALSPYPFVRQPIELRYSGRYVEPRMLRAEERWDVRFASLPLQWQTVTLRPE